MLGYGLLFDVAALVTIVVWFVGLRRTVRRTFADISEETSVDVSISRRFIFLMSELISFAGLLYGFWWGFGRAFSLTSLAGHVIAYILYVYWLVSSYEHGDSSRLGSRLASLVERKQVLPRYAVLPNWIFHNKSLFALC